MSFVIIHENTFNRLGFLDETQLKTLNSILEKAQERINKPSVSDLFIDEMIKMRDSTIERIARESYKK